MVRVKTEFSDCAHTVRATPAAALRAIPREGSVRLAQRHRLGRWAAYGRWISSRPAFPAAGVRRAVPAIVPDRLLDLHGAGKFGFMLGVAPAQEEPAADKTSDQRPPCPCCGGTMVIIETFGVWCQPRAPRTTRPLTRETIHDPA